MRLFLILLALGPALPGGLPSTPAVEPPRIEVRRGPDGTPRFIWPLRPAASLEVREAWSANTPWRDAETPPAIVDGANLVEASPTDSVRFHRLRLAPVPTTTRILERSPAPGEGGVAVTRETTVQFTRPVEFNIPASPESFTARLGDRPILGRVDLSADRRTATFFPLEPIPASARIQVTLDGLAFRDEAGDTVDADGDGKPGGRAVWEFDTGPIHAVPGTALLGRVLASELRSGTNAPLAGVTITVDGAEESLRAVTASDGTFRLEPSPAGRFFVHVDGRTAVGSQWPSGAYYPFVGKAWDAVPGRTNNLANQTGLIFLPRIGADTLQPVHPAQETVITPPAESLAAHPELAGVRITVPPNALFSESGNRGGRVGLAPVAPDRLPEPLPPGLNLPLVITIQTDGPMNFDQPVPVRFPNLPDPGTGRLPPPGSRTAIWSFNHDTGRWEIAGPAVVSADGRFVDSLPGTGVRQPGWHGAAPGTPPRGPGSPDNPDNASDTAAEDRDCDQDGATLEAALSALDCASSLAGLSRWTDAISNLGRNLVDFTETTEAMAEATGTPGFSCERFATLFGQLNVTGRTLADLASPFLATGDPTRFASAAAGCLISTAENAARLACASRCGDGQTDAARCEEMNNLTGDAIGLHEIAEADSAVEAGITAAELAGDQLASSFNAHCASGSRAGMAALQRFVPANPASEAELRRRTLDYRARIQSLHAATTAAAGASLRYERAYHDLESPLLAAASRWMIKQRAWAGAAFRLSSPGFSYRNRVSPSGEFQLPILAPNTPYTLDVFQPSRRLHATISFTSANSGDITDIPVPRLAPISNPETSPDRDADGLPDAVEIILGSLPDQADSDGDGIPDGTEIARGQDPVSDAAIADGLIANVPTDGPAVDVVEAAESLVAVACENGAVDLFDTANPAAPARIATLRAGTERPCLAAHAPWLALADPTTGLHLFDLSNPRTPVRVWTVPGRVRNLALALNDGSVFAHLNGELVALDRASGRRLHARPGIEADHLVWLGDALASYTAGSVRLFQSDPGGLSDLGSLDVPTRTTTIDQLSPRLRPAGDLATLAGLDVISILSLADRRAPTLRGSVVDPASVLMDAVPMGPDTMASVARQSDDARVVIHDLAPLPAVPARLVAVYDSPGQARALLFHQGFLYVADTRAGLSVLLQRPLDTADPAPGGPPPTLRLAGSFTRPGFQEEGSPFTLTATALGSRPLRVEFFRGDIRLGASRFPFRWPDIAPSLAALPSNLVFTARAVTAGGLISTSPPVAVALVSETVPPRPTRLDPAEGALLPAGSVAALSVTLSEPVDPASLDASTLTVWSAGPDTLPGTPDDLPVPAGTVQLADGGRRLVLPLVAPLLHGSHQARLGTALADRRGNRPIAPVVWAFEMERQIQWLSDSDGSFTDPTRWDGGSVPEYRDLAVLDRPAAQPGIRLAGTEVFVGGILSREAFVIASPVYATRDLRFEADLSVSNRALLSAQGALITRGPSSWSGPGGVVLEVARFENSGVAVLQLVGGSGLLLRSPTITPPLLVNESGGTLELRGPTTLQIDPFLSGTRIIQAGTLRSLTPAGTTNRVASRALENRGFIHATGGTLELSNPAHLGRILVDADTTVSLVGTASPEIRSTSTSTLEGAGNLALNFRAGAGATAPLRFAGRITLDGRITVAPNNAIAFLGERTSAGILDASGNVELRGLAANFGTLVLRDVDLAIATGTPVTVATLACATGPFAATGGRLRLESSLHVSGPAQLTALTLSRPGTLRLEGPVTVATTLDVLDGATLELGSSLARTNTGRLVVGESATVRILPGATLDLPSGILVRLGGSLINDGTLRTADGLAEPAEIFVTRARTIENRGLVDVRSSRLLVPAIHQTSGTVQLSGGTLDTLGLQLEGGRLTGSGDFLGAVEAHGGEVSPGTDPTAISIGTLRVADGSWGPGTYAQSAPGRLVVDLAGPAAHDRLLAGRAQLDGTLEVRLAPGFVPALDTSFVIVESPNLSGTFREVLVPSPTPGRRFEVQYLPTEVRLHVVAGP